MATLPTRSFATIVQTIVASVQGRASALIDFTVGSPLRALAEAFAGLALWLQAMILQVLAVMRLATSSGSDVDSFVGDFSLPRLSASYAGGQLTFSRLTASATSPLIPVGTTIQTQDGTVQAEVVADTSNANYSASASGYYMPANTTSVTATGKVTTAGTAGNVAAAALTVLTTPIVGVDTVANASAWTGGGAAETDAALKARFALYILGLSEGNSYGIESALANLNVDIAYQIVDQETYAGLAQPGFFYVVVDDGSGSPSSDFLLACQKAINARRALGVQFAVFAPELVDANVNIIVTSLSGYTHDDVVAAVDAAIETNITALGLGAGLDVYQIAAWALAVQGVAPGGVSGLTLNALSGDAATIAASPKARIMPGTITVS